MQLIYILHIFTINYVLQTARIKIPEVSYLKNEGASEWILFFLPSIKETHRPRKREHDGRSEVVHHLTVKLFPQVHDAMHCSPS